MADPTDPIFLEQSSYRRRRLIDAARLAPFLGIILCIAPALLLPAGDAWTLSRVVIYFFAAWIFLIIGTALIAKALTRWDEEES